MRLAGTLNTDTDLISPGLHRRGKLVTHYGAVGNGVANDTAAINAAIADSVSRKTVIPAGTFNVTGLTIGVEQTLHLSRGATLFLINSSNTHVITISSNNVNIVGNGTIDGNRANQTSGHGIFANTFNDIRIEGITVRECEEAGICGFNVSRFWVKKCRVSLTGNSGIWIRATNAGSAMEDCRVLECSVDRSDAAGNNEKCIAITRDNASRNILYPLVQGNQVKMHAAPVGANVVAIELFASDTLGGIAYGRISDNAVEGAAIGISVASRSRHCVVDGNAVFNSASIGIELADVTHCTASNNTVDGNASTDTGIVVDGSNVSSEGCNVVGNTVRNIAVGGQGIYSILAAPYLSIVGNTVFPVGATSSAIRINTSDDVRISGNTLDGGTTAGQGIVVHNGNRIDIDNNTARRFTNFTVQLVANTLTVAGFTVNANNRLQATNGPLQVLEQSGGILNELVADTLPLSPAQITADQNNYHPAGNGSGYQRRWRLSSNAERTITGIARGFDRRALTISNVGTQKIVIANQHTGSVAANRIATGSGSSLTLFEGDSLDLVYDSTTSRWRVVGPGVSRTEDSIVTHYGAVGDGTTNDTAAINAALASVTNNGKVVFPAGTYQVSGITITTPKHIVLERGATIRLINASNTHVLLFNTSGASGSVIEGHGTIDGNKANQSAGSFRCIQIESADNVRVMGLTLTSAKAEGLIAINCSDLLVERCRVRLTDTSGIQVRATAAGADMVNNRIVNCEIDRSDAAGNNEKCIAISRDPGTRNIVRAKVIGCHGKMHGTPSGVNVIPIELHAGDSSGGIAHSVVSGCTTEGGEIGISVARAHHCAVTGCTTYNADGIGIELADSSYCAVSGCTVDGNSSTATGIANDGTNVGAISNSITGNTVRNTTNQAIHVFTGAAATALGDNTLDVAAGIGIRLQNAIDTRLTGNTFKGNTTASFGLQIDASSRTRLVNNQFRGSSALPTDIFLGASNQSDFYLDRSNEFQGGTNTPIVINEPGAGLASEVWLDDQSLTPAQLTANTNDYHPGWQQVWRLSTDASRNLTGIARGFDRRPIQIVNVGANNLVIQNQNAGSLAANRIITGTGADLTLAPDDSARLIYDGTTTRWRVVATA